jgi:hypothetical protein
VPRALGSRPAMTPRRSRPLVLSALCLVALLVAAGTAAGTAVAATVKAGRACYVAKGTEGVDVGVTGSGFTPGEDVFAQVPAPGGLGAVDDTTVAADGTIRVTVKDLFPESVEPVVEKRIVQIKGLRSDRILAHASFDLTNLAVKTVPATASYRDPVTYLFAGFRPHAPIFGHYFSRGKLLLTHKFGTAEGPCGTLQAKSTLFPGTAPRDAKYKVQFDDSKHPDPHANPKIVTSLGSVF